MASTNFKIFNEENAADRTYNDSEYEQATQRQGGVTPGMALSRLHNKLYLQTSAMAKAIADFIVGQGFDCMDNDVSGITTALKKSIQGITFTKNEIIDTMYPVGIIVEFAADVDPNTKWSGTTWVKMDAGRVLVSAGTYTENGTTYTYAVGDKGGEAKHQLTTEELPAHSHSATANTVSLTGQFTVTDERFSGDGILSRSGSYNGYRLDMYSQTNANMHINATHPHSVSVENTGNNGRHENRQPYEVANRWKRTA